MEFERFSCFGRRLRTCWCIVASSRKSSPSPTRSKEGSVGESKLGDKVVDRQRSEQRPYRHLHIHPNRDIFYFRDIRRIQRLHRLGHCDNVKCFGNGCGVCLDSF